MEDHIDALIKVAFNGKVGDSYCIGASQEKSNEEIVELICELLDFHNKSNAPHNRFKVFVKDRPGHDVRYALNSSKIKKNLGWYPKTNFRQGINLTFDWYYKNKPYYKSLSKKDIIKTILRELNPTFSNSLNSCLKKISFF